MIQHAYAYYGHADGRESLVMPLNNNILLKQATGAYWDIAFRCSGLMDRTVEHAHYLMLCYISPPKRIKQT